MNGTALPGVQPPVTYSLPPGEPPHPFRAADCPVQGWWVDFDLTTGQVSAAGVEPPAPGAWTTFTLTIELTSGGVTSTTSRTVDYGRGDPVVTLTGLTTSWEGMRIQGVAVDPEATDGPRFVVVVDGAVQGTGLVPFGTVEDPDRRWYDRELGLAHQIDVTVPFGSQACVVVLEYNDGDWTPTQLAGCLEGRSAVPTGDIERVSAGPGTLTVSGWIFQPTLQLPAEGLSGWRSDGWISIDGVRAGGSAVADVWRDDLAAANPGHNARSGFSTTVRAAPGWHRVCIGKDLTDWRRFATPPPPDVVLDCVDGVLVPPAWNMPAEGAVEEITAVPGGVVVRGWAADRNGGRPRVLVSVNGLPVRLVQPTVLRRDVHDRIGADPISGFDERVQLPPGNHLVCAAWEDTGGGGWSPAVCGRTVVK